MTITKQPIGYFDKILFIDCETTGLFFNGNPVTDPLTGESYQAVSYGLIVTDANTLEPIEDLYVEIKWNGISHWNKKAEVVHGLSLQYLEEHGVEEEEAVVQIASLILKYWGPDSSVCLGGHNVATFDRLFLQDLLNRHGVNVKMGNRTIDSSAIGFATFGTYNSDDLFATVGLDHREAHNALVDAHSSLTAVRTVRNLFSRCIDG
jgi:DNA polymerase III epsilon subunit-like protein